MISSPAAARLKYNRDAVLSATPVRLLTMLYDRLLLDLNRAEAAQREADWAVASENLLHAQAILSELMSSLKVDEWDGGAGLLDIYSYVFRTLVNANIHRDANRTAEGITLLEPLRQAWHEAANNLPTLIAPTPTTSGANLGVA